MCKLVVYASHAYSVRWMPLALYDNSYPCIVHSRNNEMILYF